MAKVPIDKLSRISIAEEMSRKEKDIINPLKFLSNFEASASDNPETFLENLAHISQITYSDEEVENFIIRYMAEGVFRDNSLRDLIPLLYTAAGLTDNKKLMRRFKTERKAEVIKRMEDTPLFDAVYVTMEEIVKNEEVRKLARDIIFKKFPSSRKVYEEPTYKSMKGISEGMFRLMAFISLIQEYSPSVARIFAMSLLNDETDVKKPPLYTDGDIFIDGESILKNGVFEKYKKKRLGELCEYLEIPEEELEDLIRAEIEIQTTDVNLHVGDGIMQHMINQYLCLNHNIHQTWADAIYIQDLRYKTNKQLSSIALNYKPNLNSVIDAYYKGLINRFIRNDIVDGNTVNRRALLRYYKASPELDLNGIFFTYQMDRMLKMASCIMEEQYRNFNPEDYASKSTKTIKNSLVEELKQVSKEKDTEINALKAKVEQINLKLTADKDKSFVPYERKIKELEEKLAKKDMEIARLERAGRDKDTYIEFLESKDKDEPEGTASAVVDIEEMKKRKFLLVGGRYEMLRELAKILPNSKQVDRNTTSTINVSSIDNIVVFHDFIDHSTFYKVVNISREHNINLIYAKGSNMDKILQTIYDSMT